MVTDNTKYISCTTIILLLEHKKSYQKNMLKSFGIVIVSIFLLLTVPLIFFKQNDLKNINMKVESITENGSSKSANSLSGNQLRSRLFNNTNRMKQLLPYQHDGFAGFNGYNILEIEFDIPNINLKGFNKENYQKNINPTLLFPTEPGREYVNIIEFGGYGDDDFGLPGQKSLLEIAWGKYPKGLGQWKIEIPKPDEPAFIRITETPKHPTDAYEISGEVVVEFIITRKGTIIDRKVLSETPPDLGFAKAVLGALNEAWYWPAKNKGKAIDTKVILTWDMCWNCEHEITYGDERLIVNK